jgi:hypothetical protein
VVCSKCGGGNAPSRKFCGQCGAPLAQVCTACGSANDAEVSFCGECGAPLGAAGSPAPAGPLRPAATSSEPSPSPTTQLGTSFVSASIATQVQTSPNPNSPLCSAGTFAALEWQKAQISQRGPRRVAGGDRGPRCGGLPRCDGGGTPVSTQPRPQRQRKPGLPPPAVRRPCRRLGCQPRGGIRDQESPDLLGGV